MRLSSRIRRSPKGERGYIMMMLLLIIALMAIAVGIIVPSITYDIKHDREEEMIHRGTQYTRAVRAYYKRFGRYPAKIEDLENTNQMRFLRKRYKDPITGKDFRLLHFGEVKMAMNAMMGNTGLTGPINGAPGFTQGNSLNSNSGFGSSSTSAFGQNSLGQNSQTSTPQTGSGTSQNGNAPTDAGTIVDNTNPNGSSNSGDTLSGKTFGGMPIIGVASTSPDPGFHEFDHKKKYKEWAFVYDPSFDRGLLITTPYQPQLQMFGQGAPNLNGPNGSTQPGGIGVTITNPSNGLNNSNSGFGNSNPPPSSPPQQ